MLAVRSALAAALVATAAAANGLCYKTKLQGALGAREFVLKPITGIPAGHVLTEETVCGNSFAPGDPIPGGDQLWSTSGQSDPTHRKCKNTTGSGLFYAYNYPYGSSSNTGFEQDRAVVVYFVVDASEALSLVLVFDRPGNGNRGSVEMAIDAPDLVGHDVRFALRDDTHEPACPSGGMCQWDPATARLDRMRWDWVGCCTDGMVLGNLPSADGFRIPFAFGLLEGIDTFKMASWDAGSSTVSFEEVPVAEVLAGGFSVEAETCTDYCSQKASCGECSLDDNCGWCGATGECVEAGGTAAAACPAGFNDGSECCAACVAMANFTECMPAAGCGWDHDHALCISVAGTEGEPDFVKCNATDYVTQSCGDDCPPDLDEEVCPGAVHAADGSLAAWCSGNGECDWGTKECACAEGFGGAGCETECPGRLPSGEHCSGHGVCGGDATCTCDCGYAGPGCAEDKCVEQCSQPPPDLELVCVIWPDECHTVCGARLAGDRCTGGESPFASGECECLEGWWGADCTQRCPGIEADGSGLACGGTGTCDRATGQCACEGCSAPDATGTCVPTEPAECANNGASFCPAESGGAGPEHACRCIGQWAGPLCTKCACPGAATCSSINGQCRYSACAEGQFELAPGSLESDTVCAAITQCAEDELEIAPPTATSDRLCAGPSTTGTTTPTPTSTATTTATSTSTATTSATTTTTPTSSASTTTTPTSSASTTTTPTSSATTTTTPTSSASTTTTPTSSASTTTTPTSSATTTTTPTTSATTTATTTPVIEDGFVTYTDNGLIIGVGTIAAIWLMLLLLARRRRRQQSGEADVTADGRKVQVRAPLALPHSAIDVDQREHTAIDLGLFGSFDEPADSVMLPLSPLSPLRTRAPGSPASPISPNRGFGLAAPSPLAAAPGDGARAELERTLRFAEATEQLASKKLAGLLQPPPSQFEAAFGALVDGEAKPLGLVVARTPASLTGRMADIPSTPC